MRGLKLSKNTVEYWTQVVASFTDAWIETTSIISKARCAEVASFTDAWIETKRRLQRKGCYRSHLLQMRGLKLRAVQQATGAGVASFTDAWIETIPCDFAHNKSTSRIFYRCVD